MVRKLVVFTVMFMMFLGVSLAADENNPRKKGPGKFDKGKIFEKIDVDGKGEVTKEQFLKFMTNMKGRFGNKAPGGKEIPEEKMTEMLNKMFERFDSNGDGKISKDEFEKGSFFGDKAGGFKGKGRPGFPGKKPGAE